MLDFRAQKMAGAHHPRRRLGEVRPGGAGIGRASPVAES